MIDLEPPSQEHKPNLTETDTGDDSMPTITKLGIGKGVEVGSLIIITTLVLLYRSRGPKEDKTLVAGEG